MEKETITLLVVGILLLFLVLALLAWVFRVAAVLSAAFTSFMLELPLIIMLLAFILFPPTLIVFLVGWFVLTTGMFDEEEKVRKRDKNDIKKIRRELGHDTDKDIDA